MAVTMGNAISAGYFTKSYDTSINECTLPVCAVGC